jgi:toxin HigB-1
MDSEYANDEMLRLDCDPAYFGSWPRELARAYRKGAAVIRAARDEADLRAMNFLCFDRLQGARAHQRSIKLSDRWRLIFEVSGQPPTSVVRLVGIEDSRE